MLWEIMGLKPCALAQKPKFLIPETCEVYCESVKPHALACG